MGANLDALLSATQDLRELKDYVLQRVNNEVAVSRNMKPTEQVTYWLSRVAMKLLEVDELIKERPPGIHRDFGFLRCLNCISWSRFGGRVAIIFQEIRDLKLQGGFKEVAEIEEEEAAESPEKPLVIYFRTMLEKVLYFLELEDRVGTIGIFGKGGIGKTTLLTRIKNNLEQRDHLNYVVIWVRISKYLKLDKVQEEIAASIGLLNDEQWDTKTFDEKALAIFKKLQKMKFLLLLDDVWEQVGLEGIGVPPLFTNKCKIIFTTRFEQVCDRMKATEKFEMEPLSWERSWKLFQEKVGTGKELIPPIAEDVARECHGLPLSLITIGCAMSTKKTVEEWEYAVEMLRKSSYNLQGTGNEVFSNLKFSYDNLPSYKVKSCFLYCCLFPEHFKILKSDVVEYWICENFWENDGSQADAFSEGYRIIDTLVYACLLEEEGNFVKMHDVIRDMGLWIACEIEKEKENYLVQVGVRLSKPLEIDTWAEARRISLMENDIQELTEVLHCPHLLTLFLCYNLRLSVIAGGFFLYMKMLTVLDLSNSSLRVLPTGISNLVSLQYLNLSRTRINELTLELLELKVLKYLNLEYMFLLCCIPRRMISNFSLLQVLRMSGCGLVCSVEEDKGDINVEEIEGLEHLQLLSITINQAIVFDQIFKSKKLFRCIKSLHFSDIMESEIFNLGDPEELNVDSITEEEKTQAPRDGVCNSARLRNRYFDNLQSVYIYLCPHLQNLTWLVLAPNLTNLHICECEELEEIISFEKLGENQNYPFARLKVLQLLDLEQLKSIYWKRLPLKYLEEITVLGCPLLKKLPVSAEGKEVVIRGETEWWHNLELEDNVSVRFERLHGI